MKRFFYQIILVIFLLIPLLSLFCSGLPTTHDGPDHVARIANFYKNLTEGNIIPRWAGNLNWGYGHPILEFLYPAPSYLASLFHFLGFSLVDSTKIVFGLGFLLSGIFMYLWLSQFLKKDIALFGAILYTYAPYRFVDLYVRGAIGENTAFIWLPLILYFIYKLFKNNNYKNIIYLGISFALLVLSHNALSLVFLPFIIFYAIFLCSDNKLKASYIYNFISAIILGFLLSAFFWIPALIEGKYTLRNILTSGVYVNRFVDFNALIYGPWNYGQSGEFTVQLGIIHWLLFLASFIVLFYFLKKRNKNYILILGTIIYSLIAIFLMLKISNFIWEKVMILQNFQFPWRLLAITTFSTSLLGALTISVINDKVRKKLVFFLLIILFLLSFNYMKPSGCVTKPESFYTGVFEKTTDTGESSPIWSVRFMEKTPEAPIQVIGGKGYVGELVHKSTYRLYEFKSENSAQLLINILYFPGWKIYVDEKEESIQFQDPNHRGLITLYVAKGNHKIEAVFENTKIRKYSDILSFLGLLFIIGLFSYKIIKK